MIVRRREGRVWLVPQPEHAALSGRIMEAWQEDGLPGHRLRAAILTAVREHDNGWREEDQVPIFDPHARGCADFIGAPVEVRQRVWPRGVSRFADSQPLVAALIAQHALTVYDRYRGRPDWTPFFESIAATRDALLPRTELAAAPDAGNGAALAGLQEIYRFVFIGDLISLVFCNGWREEQSRGRYMVRLDGDVVEVAPDPFGGRRIPVAVSGRSLPDRPYGSAADLIGEWARAPRGEWAGGLIGVPAPDAQRAPNSASSR